MIWMLLLQPINYCHRNNLNYAFKLHPKESIEEYLNYYPDAYYLPIKQPLELIVLNCSKAPTVVSINSTAGLGFERFCNRVPLIPDTETSRFAEIMCEWEKHPDNLKSKIKELLD